MMEGAKAGGVIVFLTAKSQPPSALVHLLSREFQMPIGDQTGLQGEFDSDWRSLQSRRERSRLRPRQTRHPMRRTTLRRTSPPPSSSNSAYA